MKKVKVAVNGYGVIGKRVADAVRKQSDMELVGINDISTDWRIFSAINKGIKVFTPDPALNSKFSIPCEGSLQELIEKSDIIVDCTPKKIAAQNIIEYKKANKKFIVHGGEKHEVTNHSFNAETNYDTALGRSCTRVVSCNTTSILRSLGVLKNAGLLKKARGTLLRRATDPWESHLGGIMNTLLPEQDIPSHQGPDAQTVDPELDVVTMAVKTPQTLSHLHYWNVELTQTTSKEKIIELFSESNRILLLDYKAGLVSNNAIKEFMMDRGRPYGDMYEIAIWKDMLEVKNNELFYAYIVDNQAIVIPETIDAIRALTEIESNHEISIQKTDSSLEIGSLK